jgi:hypothetical protein
MPLRALYSFAIVRRQVLIIYIEIISVSMIISYLQTLTQAIQGSGLLN